MKVEIVDFFPTEAGAEAGVFYFNRYKKTAILYRDGNKETYHAILPNMGQPGSRFQDSDGDGIPDIREASVYDLQDIGWTSASGSTFNKPTYTSVGNVTVTATQVAISSLGNPINILFNGSSNTIRINKATEDGAIQRHDNTWDNFVKNQTIDIHNGDYLIYDTFVDSDGDGTADSRDAFPNDPNEDTDIDGDGVGANTDVDDFDANRGSGNDTDGDGIDDEFDSNNTDGPIADSDGDGIINSQDPFPDDSSNAKYDQQLSWNEMSGSFTTAGGPYGLSASTDSGETISFSIASGPGTINGNMFSPSSAGAVVIEASAPGNTQYNPASVNKNFNILDATTDTDGDGTPDLTDTDDDGDGVPDGSDAFPEDSSESSDRDGDGVGDNSDPWPDDNTKDSAISQSITVGTMQGTALLSDGTIDLTGTATASSGLPVTFGVHALDSTRGSVSGNILTLLGGGNVTITIDQIGNSQYLAATQQARTIVVTDDVIDSDNDGVRDLDDNFPSDPNKASGTDTDGDGTDNEFDDDDDGDGVLDINDDLPLNPNESTDTDSDGIGDNADTDDDNDSIPDFQDSSHPNNANQPDSDGDGIIDSYDSSDDRAASYIILPGSYERMDAAGGVPYSTSWMAQRNTYSNQTFSGLTGQMTILMDTPPTWANINDNNHRINATATVSIASGQSIASLNNGVLSFSGDGIVDVEVSFAGNTSYLPAVTRTIRYNVGYSNHF